DEHYFLDVGWLELRVGERLLHWAHGAVNDGMNQRVQSAAREFVNVDAAIGQRKTQCGSLRFRKLMLNGDEGLAQFLCKFAMRREVDFVGLKNLLVNERLQQVVDIIPAEVRIAVGREDLVDVAFSRGDEFQNRNIESAATEIVNGDASTLFLVQAVPESSGSWLIHEAQDFEASDFASVFGGLPLRVVKIRWDSDDGSVDGLAEKGFGPTFQFAQDERGNFRRSENFIAKHNADNIFASGIDAKREKFQFALHVRRAAAHEALHGKDGALGLGE